MLLWHSASQCQDGLRFLSSRIRTAVADQVPEMLQSFVVAVAQASSQSPTNLRVVGQANFGFHVQKASYQLVSTAFLCVEAVKLKALYLAPYRMANALNLKPKTLNAPNPKPSCQEFRNITG